MSIDPSWWPFEGGGFGDAVALLDVAGGRAVRHRELDDALRGVEVGESSWSGRVDRGFDEALAMLAAWRRGGVVAPFSSRLPEAEQGRRAGLLAAAGCPAGAATIFHTSGSTGGARAVAHRPAAHVLNADGAASRIPLHPGCGWLMSLPMHHVSGFAVLVRCLRAGATVVFPDPSMPFELQVADQRVTHVSVVEVQLARLLARPGIPSHLRAVLAGGGPIGLSTVRRAIEAGLPLHTTYGMTETASQIATTGRLESAPRAVHAGRVLPGREVRIGAGGAIMVRGGVLAASILEEGRWRCPADGDGWFDTGDVGFFDDGNLVVAGRKDRMIISGGENIHPEALEKILEEVAGVRRAVVVGVPDAKWGARPVAFLAGTAAESTARRHLGGRVEDFAMPDRFLPWPDGVDPSAAKIDFRRFEKLARMG